ncbi:MAG: hypothetical protein OEM38_00920 [Gammaproteobacteria bacterium]|nr:hypothetical protein [Gammaproteobacteria bacterium]
MSTIVIGFDNAFNETSKIMINIESPIAEHENIWVWDHFFSLVLNRLSDSEDKSQQLLDHMSEWAVGFANKMYSPINELHAEGAFKIDKNLRVEKKIDQCDEVIMIEVSSQADSWPTVHAKINDDTSPEKLSSSVIALAQYFLSNNTNFFRELPMHVLGMRKFYNDEMSFTSEESISGAPAFSFNLALKFYQDLDQKLQRQ